MIINNKLDRSFGAGGKFAGIVLVAIGLITIIHIWTVIFIILGGFIGFTHSGAQIDADNNKVRLYQNLFGIIKTGRWKKLGSFKGLTIVPVKRITSISSYSNRQTSIEQNDYRIFIVNKFKKPDFPIRKCTKKSDAKKAIEELSLLLNMPVFSIVPK